MQVRKKGQVGKLDHNNYVGAKKWEMYKIKIDNYIEDYPPFFFSGGFVH